MWNVLHIFSLFALSEFPPGRDAYPRDNLGRRGGDSRTGSGLPCPKWAGNLKFGHYRALYKTLFCSCLLVDSYGQRELISVYVDGEDANCCSPSISETLISSRNDQLRVYIQIMYNNWARLAWAMPASRSTSNASLLPSRAEVATRRSRFGNVGEVKTELQQVDERSTRSSKRWGGGTFCVTSDVASIGRESGRRIAAGRDMGLYHFVIFST